MGGGEGCVQGSGCRAALGGLPTTLVVLSAGDMRSALFLLPALQKLQLGFWGLFVSCCPEFAPMAHAHSYF